MPWRNTSLNVEPRVKWHDETLKTVAEHRPALTSLNVAVCRKLTDEALKAAAEHCPCSHAPTWSSATTSPMRR